MARAPRLTDWLTDKALREGFRRTKENQGCAGADGVTLGGYEAGLALNLEALRGQVEEESYFAWPLRRILVEKRAGSEESRTLLVPAVRDRVLQTAVARALEPVLEAEFEECSYGYRRGRSVRMAVERVAYWYSKGYKWVLDADIDAFFDSVDREEVLSRLGSVISDEGMVRLVRLWLDYAVWDGLKLVRPERGIPQGSVVSPMMANLCLDKLDERLLAEDMKVIRYADDFVVVTKSERSAEEARELTEQVLGELKLKLHATKTRVVRFSEGFKFLGVIFLKDMLLQPWQAKRKKLKILAAAGEMPETFFPASERRALRKYRA